MLYYIRNTTMIFPSYEEAKKFQIQSFFYTHGELKIEDKDILPVEPKPLEEWAK